jgi:hypothetical protein
MKGDSMETDGRFKSADQRACNGKPIANLDPGKPILQLRRVSRKILWGASMVSVALFRLLMTWVIGVPAEPVSVLITAIFGVVGIVLLMWSAGNRRE